MRNASSFFATASIVVLVSVTPLACGGSSSDGADVDASIDAAVDASSDTSSAETPLDTSILPDSTYDGPDSGGGPCGADGACSGGLSCCGSVCVNLRNDPLNCGACGTRCSGETSMCNGTCTKPTCAPACTGDQVCCLVNTAGPPPPPSCYPGPTCPVGCPFCT